MRSAATGNQILDYIGRANASMLAALWKNAYRFSAPAGLKLQAAGAEAAFVYFPVSGLLSLTLVLDDGSEVHAIEIGSEGAVNAGPQIDFIRTAHNVLVPLPSNVIRIPRSLWQESLSENGDIRDMLAAYTTHLLLQSHQALACCVKHDTESRLCRWLLNIHHWQDGKPLRITHQGLAGLLGVRRSTVTMMTSALEEAEIISCHRGLIEIEDCYALEEASCECHSMRHDWQTWLQKLPPS